LSNNKYDFINLRNRKDNIIGKTKVNHEVYIHVLKNNYAIYKGEKYVYIVKDGKNILFHKYIYYTFYNNTFNKLKPFVDHKNINFIYVWMM